MPTADCRSASSVAFLTWLQEKQDGVFVVAAANDIARLPPELLRKGRFDEIFFVGPPVQEERETIFTIHLRARKQDVAQFRSRGARRAAEGFNGAEIEQDRDRVALSHAAREGAADYGRAPRLRFARRSRFACRGAEDVAKLRAFSESRFTPVA
jgi:SpoVK/Ycf46/Vps4 family AAA+-type ATPase